MVHAMDSPWQTNTDVPVEALDWYTLLPQASSGSKYKEKEMVVSKLKTIQSNSDKYVSNVEANKRLVRTVTAIVSGNTYLSVNSSNDFGHLWRPLPVDRLVVMRQPGVLILQNMYGLYILENGDMFFNCQWTF